MTKIVVLMATVIFTLLPQAKADNGALMKDLLSRDLDCVAKRGQEEVYWAYAFRLVNSQPTFCMYRSDYGPLDSGDMIQKFCREVNSVKGLIFTTKPIPRDAGDVVELLDVIHGTTSMADIPGHASKIYVVHRVYAKGTGDVDLYCYEKNRERF